MPDTDYTIFDDATTGVRMEVDSQSLPDEFGLEVTTLLGMSLILDTYGKLQVCSLPSCETIHETSLHDITKSTIEDAYVNEDEGFADAGDADRQRDATIAALEIALAVAREYPKKKEAT